MKKRETLLDKAMAISPSSGGRKYAASPEREQQLLDLVFAWFTGVITRKQACEAAGWKSVSAQSLGADVLAKAVRRGDLVRKPLATPKAR